MADTPSVRHEARQDEPKLNPALMPVAAPVAGVNAWRDADGKPAPMFAVALPPSFPVYRPHVLKIVGVSCLVLIVRESRKDADTAALLAVLATQEKRTVYCSNQTADTGGVFFLSENDDDLEPVSVRLVAFAPKEEAPGAQE